MENFTPQEENVAQQSAELLGAITNLLPGMTAEKSDQYLKLIGEKVKAIAEHPAADNKIKDVTENVVDLMAAIGDVLPEPVDPIKKRQLKRYKSAIGVIRNFLHLFGY